MLVLLPPSETKRDGGDDRSLDLSRLSFQGLTVSRAAALDATSALALDPDAMAAALRLGPTQRGELERNRRIAQSPVMPAMDRYTGVLYDALD
ncbi:MAG: peroxide stress protein YaaA, partial [Microbacteriaceae bacterium]|nr:peroxide stress protein YaaA [Microbacteriaceae bacterium]